MDIALLDTVPDVVDPVGASVKGNGLLVQRLRTCADHHIICV